MSEKRLTQIRERCEAALQSAPCVYYLDEWPGILRNDVPFLLAEVERLKRRNHLETAVVTAALAERQALLRERNTFPARGGEAAWCDAVNAYCVAVDALLAFREEASDE